MRYFEYLEQGPDGETIRGSTTDREILRSYFPYWKKEMVAAGKESMIDEETCIEDWIADNWAWEVEGYADGSNQL